MVGFEPTSGGVKVRSLNRLATPQNTYLNYQTIKLGKKGFEPLTPWFVATCSSPLSYKPNIYF